LLEHTISASSPKPDICVDQTTANQERELREIADRMGCEIVKVYKDHGISGTRGRDKRPSFDKLWPARREFDVVMAWSVDRLGRSLQDLVGFLSELHALKIDLLLRQQGLDTTTPAGKAMFQMMGVFAEFERAMIAERVRAGLARARGEDKRLGRPPIAPELQKRILDPRASGGSVGLDVLVEAQRWRCPPQQRRERRLAHIERLPAKVVTVELDQVEREDAAEGCSARKSQVFALSSKSARSSCVETVRAAFRHWSASHR
jgi:DNA invertase Pin-like site-specific DNA recombinase